MPCSTRASAPARPAHEPARAASCARRKAVAGAVILAALVAMALSAPLLFPAIRWRSPARRCCRPFQDWSLPLGTDRLGRDVLAELFHGARTSLAVGLAAAAAALVVGSVVGTLAGFAGGLVDEVLMRITDAFQTVPGFLLALAFVSVVGPSLGVVVLAIALRRLDRPGPHRPRRSPVDPRARLCRRRPRHRHASAGDRLPRGAAQRAAAGAGAVVGHRRRRDPDRSGACPSSASATPTASPGAA